MSLLVILFAWIATSPFINLHEYFLPDPSGLGAAFLREFGNGSLLGHLGRTGSRLLLGLAGGVSVGLAFGLACSLSMKLRQVLLPITEFLRGIPTSMLFPLFIVFAGVGELSKALIVLYATGPVIVISCVAGTQPSPENQPRYDYLSVNSAHLSFRFRVFCLLWDALPSVVAGLKVAVSMGLVLVVVTEMFFVASSGVGWAAHQAYLAFDLDTLYLYILVVGLVGLLLNFALDRLLLLATSQAGR